MSSTGSYSSGGMPKNPTFSTLKISAGGTFDLYNTADKTTNYERLRADWSANVARLQTQAGGTGTARAIQIASVANGGGTSVRTTWSRSSFPIWETTIDSTSTTGNMYAFTGSFSQSSGTTSVVNITPGLSQSGTAGYTALDINPTETATGSGTKLLQRWAVGGSAKAQIDNSGSLSATNLTALNTLGLATAPGTTGDVNLSRDAADTLALRRSTNAQTFRGYETYTDASNYSRWYQTFSAGFAYYGTQAAGTGTRRPLIVQHHQTTVATLPAAATVGAGSRCHVSDALGPVFGTAVAGGGAVSVPVYSDGAAWIVG